VLVDTTCGSVLNVWKRDDAYAKDGFTAVIHGKYHHEETKATSSSGYQVSGRRFLVVRDMDDAREVCRMSRERGPGTDLWSALPARCRPASIPTANLVRVGVANQTTMLSGESLAIAAEIRRSMVKRLRR